MYKVVALFIFLSLMQTALAVRFFSGFRSIPAAEEERVSSVFIGRVTLDSSIECSFQPICFTTLDTAWDTREVLEPRQGLEVLVPMPRQCDRFGRDINARGDFILNAFESGLGLLINGPASDGYASAALIAGDFVGAQEATIGAFRLLLAFTQFEFPTGMFFFGQLWHPFIIPDCFAQTVSFSNGSPFDPRTRCPQLRYLHKGSLCDVLVTAYSQGSYISPGPIGPSFTYFCNAVIPGLCINVRKNFDVHQIGAAVDFKTLVPRLVSDKNLKVNEYVHSVFAQAWVAFNFMSSSIRMKVLYAQNAADHIMLSGYAVRTIDPVTDARTYSPTAVINAWIDTSYVLPSKTSELGLFVAVGKNLGSSKELVIDKNTGAPIVYPSFGFIANLDLAWRVAPRFVWTKEPLRFGLELEATWASYGVLDRFARVHNAQGVINYRLLASWYYVF